MNITTATAKETRDQFMQLLVTQLQNQDPLSPMKQEEFLSQLAQFSTLEGIENLNETIESQVRLQEESVRFQQLTQAATLVGAEVTYAGRDSAGVPQDRTGIVNSVSFDGNQIAFQVDGVAVKWSDIKSVQTGTEDSMTSGQPGDTDTDVLEDARQRAEEPILRRTRESMLF